MRRALVLICLLPLLLLVKICSYALFGILVDDIACTDYSLALLYMFVYRVYRLRQSLHFLLACVGVAYIVGRDERAQAGCVRHCAGQDGAGLCDRYEIP